MSATFVRARKKLADADLDWLVQTFNVALCRASSITQCIPITAATNATPIVITANSHGLSNGDFVDIFNVGGNTNANGHARVANVTTNTFELQSPVNGTNIAGNGAYTSGGYVLGLEVIEFLGDIAGAAVVSRTAALASKTSTRGIIDAADSQFASVPTGAACDLMILYRNSGSDATSEVYMTLSSFVSGMPVTPNGGNIDLVFNALGIAQIF